MPAKFSDSQFHVLKHYKRKGLSQRQMAAELGVSAKTVSLWSKRDYPPSQKPRHVKRSLVKKIRTRQRWVKALVEEKVLLPRVRYTTKRRTPVATTVVRHVHQSTRQVARALGARGQPVTSHSTVWRDLRKLGKKAVRAGRGPKLTAEHRRLRVAFARACIRQKLHTKRVLFSDESLFDCNDHVSRWYWVGPSEQPPVSEQCRESEKVLCWAVIARGGYRQLVILDSSNSRLTKESYEEKVLARVSKGLASYCQEHPDAYFQQDNAPCHSQSAKYLERRRVRLLPLSWPAKSCDLNCVEHIWNHLKEKVSQRGPTGRDELEKFLREEFFLIPDAFIDHTCKSFEKKLRECIRLEGAVVK